MEASEAIRRGIEIATKLLAADINIGEELKKKTEAFISNSLVNLEKVNTSLAGDVISNRNNYQQNRSR